MDDSRAFVKDVKRVIVKVGSGVVTRDDGRLAIGRLGSLCEQLKELNSKGYEIILVSSGAVSLGRQRLRFRRVANCSFSDLENLRLELDAKACAAVGQNSLMTLYDSLFSQLDVTAAELLVTEKDFQNPKFKMQLSGTVSSLLALKVIPIFNENDALCSRRASAQDCGIFYDNDSLSALLASELEADLLVLLSDVDGLYSGPPSDPHSKLIRTFVKEKHEGAITFGDKSSAGRGGMTSKVKAAIKASQAGTPVIITSGFAIDNIIKVLKGERIGTLFHRNAHKWVRPITEASAEEIAVAALESSRRLQAMSAKDRRQILMDIADALEANEEAIKSENGTVVSEASAGEAMPDQLTATSGKIPSIANSIRMLANMTAKCYY